LRRRVAVVTDSTADVPSDRAAELDITVVPLFVNFGDARFRDGVELSRADFYRRLEAGGQLPTTSQPTAAAFEAAYAPHVRAGHEIVSIHIMARLSGTINAARAGAAPFSGTPIHLVDSASVSGGCALLVLHAAEMARGGAGAEAILGALAGDKSRQSGYCVLADLSHAVRTGRLSCAQAALGSLLKIVPVLRLGRGEIETAARVRTFERAQETLIASTLADLGADTAPARIAVVHADAREGGRKLLERLRARLPAPPQALEFIEAGPAIAVHSGSGALAVFSIRAA
jgi:DegV family protein with EDD domain